MIGLERKALDSFAHPPDVWYRYVDDTFTYMLEEYIESFLEHLNQQHQRIKFTVEMEEERTLPFLDTLISVVEGDSISSKVYRKKTHTEQYLNFNSNHHGRQKVGIVSTLMKRLELVSKDQDKEEEKQHVQKAFRSCGYPEWTLQKDHSKKKEVKEEQIYLKRVSVPYTKGLSERFSRSMKKYMIDTVHKPTTTIKNVLCSKAKDKLHPMDKPGVVYSVECHSHGSLYVGMTGRAARERFYEHRVVSHEDAKRSHSLGNRIEKDQVEQEIVGVRRSCRNTERKDYKSMHTGSNQLLTIGDTVVSKHMALMDHKPGDIELKILDFEPNWKRRTIKEKIAINKLSPDLNEHEGYHLSAIFDPLPSKFQSGRSRQDAVHLDADGSHSTEEPQRIIRNGTDEA